jgi:hypothetical protein
MVTAIVSNFPGLCKAGLGIHPKGKSFSFTGESVIQTKIPARPVDEQVHTLFIM